MFFFLAFHIIQFVTPAPPQSFPRNICSFKCLQSKKKKSVEKKKSLILSCSLSFPDILSVDLFMCCVVFFTVCHDLSWGLNSSYHFRLFELHIFREMFERTMRSCFCARISVQKIQNVISSSSHFGWSSQSQATSSICQLRCWEPVCILFTHTYFHTTALNPGMCGLVSVCVLPC